MNRNKSKTMKKRCLNPGECMVRPLYDRDMPLAMSIPIESRQPSLQERREMLASAAESRMNLNRERTPRSTLRRSPSSSPGEEGVAEFLDDLEEYDYNDGLFLRTGEGLYVRPPNEEIRSRMDNLSREARIRRTVEGDPGVAPLTDYMRTECIGAQCTPLHEPLYYRELKNRARHNRQRDLQKRLVRKDIPRSRQQRTLRSRQHDVADRLSLIDKGLDNDVMARVHHFLKKKGHDLDVNKRYLERRGW